MNSRAAVLCGLGAAVPRQVVTNASLARRFDTTEQWISSRTGVRTRHVAGPGTSTADLAVAAARRALRAADRSVDLVILATTTPDQRCPATAPTVAHRLGLGAVPAFDVSAVCSGFVYALAIGTSAVESGLAGSALVVGADRFTSLVDPNDRGTATIFGDGAGAVVLEAGDSGDVGAVLATDLGSDGEAAGLIGMTAGEHFRMEGGAVYRRAVRHMSESTRLVVGRAGWTTDSVDRLVGHQANLRILHTLADELDLPPERVVANVDTVGNTSAASIPLALADAAGASVIRAGERVVLTGFGGGLTWGSAALVWPDTPGLAPDAVRRPSGPSRTVMQSLAAAAHVD